MLFSFVLGLTCLSTNTLEQQLRKLDLLVPSVIVQIRAVESPDLDKRKSKKFKKVAHQPRMNTKLLLKMAKRTSRLLSYGLTETGITYEFFLSKCIIQIKAATFARIKDMHITPWNKNKSGTTFDYN